MLPLFRALPAALVIDVLPTDYMARVDYPVPQLSQLVLRVLAFVVAPKLRIEQASSAIAGGRSMKGATSELAFGARSRFLRGFSPAPGMSFQPSIYHGASLSLCLFATPEAKPGRRFDAGRMNSHGPPPPFGPDADRISNAFILHKLRMDRN